MSVRIMKQTEGSVGCRRNCYTRHDKTDRHDTTTLYMTRQPNTMRDNTSARHVMTTLYNMTTRPQRNMSRHDNNMTRDLTRQYDTRQHYRTQYKTTRYVTKPVKTRQYIVSTRPVNTTQEWTRQHTTPQKTLKTRQENPTQGG